MVLVSIRSPYSLISASRTPETADTTVVAVATLNVYQTGGMLVDIVNGNKLPSLELTGKLTPPLSLTP